MDKLKQEYYAEVRKGFDKESKELFNAFPALESFSWPQYTPYFNDGDTCVFRARIDDPDINGVEGYDIHEAWSTYPAENSELLPLKQAVETFLRSLDDDSLLELFGDHVRVIVTRNGATPEEYSHG